jgi:ribosome-associated translation inhibitor RaiA
MAFHIHFRDVPHSDALRDECEGWATTMRDEFPETTRVEVTLQQARDAYEAHVHTTGKHVNFVGSGRSPESLVVAAREAFDKVHAQLRKHHDKQVFAHRRDGR